MSIAYIIPTYNRPESLRATLRAIEALGPHDAQIVIINNDAANEVRVPNRLASHVPITLLAAPSNMGAASRTIAARVASAPWLIMLDDDSAPTSLGFLRGLAHASQQVAAIAADISLPDGSRESGGLPEVFVGCGVAIRREIYLSLGGYDPTFNYYAEEYDLAARMIAAGYRCEFDPAFTVMHRKVTAGRSMNTIVSRLVRNNGWVMHRYAPEAHRIQATVSTIKRYRAIANRESALRGYIRGLSDLRSSVSSQFRQPLSIPQWDRFTGLAFARAALAAAFADRPFSSATIVEGGKNEWAIQQALNELGCHIGDGKDDAAVKRTATGIRVIGTLSRGSALNALSALANKSRDDTRTLSCFGSVQSLALSNAPRVL